ncbi:MAG: hypothetical protein RR189_00675 [Bacilli bacterium]
MNNMYNNYQKLLKIKHHNYFLLIVVITLISVFISYISNYKIYDKFNTYGVYKNGAIILNVEMEYSDTLFENNILKINKKEVDYEIVSLSDLLFDKNINYQEVILKTKETYQENKILNLTFYYNKEKIFKKIINLVKE